MDVGKVAAINPIQNPVRKRRAEVAVQFRHRVFFDAASKATSHNELRAFPEFLDERSDFAEVVSQVGVAHQNPLAADVRN
jgi:hypothetical protein